MSKTLTRYGQTILYRVAAKSISIQHSVLEEIIGEALGRLSDDENAELTSIIHGEHQMRFVKLPSAIFKDFSVLTTKEQQRQGYLQSDNDDGDLIDIGGSFQKCENFVGSYLVSVSNIENRKSENHISEIPVKSKAPSSQAEASNRRRELYKSLFDETVEENELQSKSKAPEDRLKQTSRRSPEPTNPSKASRVDLRESPKSKPRDHPTRSSREALTRFSKDSFPPGTLKDSSLRFRESIPTKSTNDHSSPCKNSTKLRSSRDILRSSSDNQRDTNESSLKNSKISPSNSSTRSIPHITSSKVPIQSVEKTVIRGVPTLKSSKTEHSGSSSTEHPRSESRSSHRSRTSIKDKIELLDKSQRKSLIKSEESEYVPEYLVDKRKRFKLSETDYVPSRLLGSEKKDDDAYVPTLSRKQSQPSYHYEPSRQPSTIEQYVPKKLTDITSSVKYKPKRLSKQTKVDIMEYVEEKEYEPDVCYTPKKLEGNMPESQDDSFGLRVVRRKAPVQLPVQISRGRRSSLVERPKTNLKRAEGPEKCFDPEALRASYEDLSIGGVPDRDSELERQVSRLTDLSSMTDRQIRYFFRRMESEVISVPTGKVRRRRHDLFMADKREVLNHAIPMSAVTKSQLDLIKKLCLEHFKMKLGFNVFYVMQVLLPEVIIRLHMAVHGSTFDESDKQTDMKLVDMGAAHSKLMSSSSISKY